MLYLLEVEHVINKFKQEVNLILKRNKMTRERELINKIGCLIEELEYEESRENDESLIILQSAMKAVDKLIYGEEE